MDSSMWQPVMQGGAFGLCLVLIGVLCWTIKLNSKRNGLREVFDKTVEVIERNSEVHVQATEAFKRLAKGQEDIQKDVKHLDRELLRRPCLRQ